MPARSPSRTSSHLRSPTPSPPSPASTPVLLSPTYPSLDASSSRHTRPVVDITRPDIAVQGHSRESSASYPTLTTHSVPLNASSSDFGRDPKFQSLKVQVDETNIPDFEEVLHPKVCCLSLRWYNVLVLSVSLMLLFAAFNTLQSWETSLLDTLGNHSLTTLYIAVCISLFITPPFVNYIGERRSIVIGAFCYILYMASLIHVIDVVVLIASAINGFGASILWVSVGGFLTKCSNGPNDRGLVTGVFWFIFQLSLIIGNLIAYYVIQDLSTTALYIMFTSMGALGTVSLLLLRSFPDSQSTAITPTSENLLEHKLARPPPTSRELLRCMRELFAHSPLVLLLPAFVFQGMEFSMWNGEFPLLFDADSLGLIFLWAGVGEALGGLTMGWLSDRIGHSLTWLIGTGLFVFSFIGMYLIGHQVPAAVGVEWNNVSLFGYLCAFTFGLADAVVNTQIYALLGNLYKVDRTEEEMIVLAEHGVVDDSDMKVVAAFTSFNFLQNCGAAIGFFYQPLVPSVGATDQDGKPLSGTSNIQLWVEAGLLVASAIGFVACDRGWLEHFWCRETPLVIREPDSIRSNLLSSSESQFIFSPVFVPRSRSISGKSSAAWISRSASVGSVPGSPSDLVSGSPAQLGSPLII